MLSCSLVCPAAPLAQYTHWKQTVFYLQDVITANRGEELRVRHLLVLVLHAISRALLHVSQWCARACQGVLTCAPNAKNHRDLDITISYDFKGAVSSMEGSQTYRLR